MIKEGSFDKVTLIANVALASIFGLIIFHAPLSVFFGQYLDTFIVKSWKELILLFAFPLIIFIVWRSGKMAQFSRDIVLRLILFYALLHVLFLFIFETNLNQKLAGLAIDLRYLLFFGLVYCLVKLQPNLRKVFLKVGAWAAGLSVGFATLQALVLPPDVLKHIGYSKDTIYPYLTVDKNSDFIRINGTLRGPNPLGAYVMIVLTLLITFSIGCKSAFSKYKQYIAVGAAALLVVLWFSYSRSALLGIVASLGIVFFVAFRRKLRLLHRLALSGVILLFAAVIFIARDSAIVQNVIIHNDPTDSESFNSNQGHAVSLESGLVKMIQQPLGGGIGSTGSASLQGDSPLIIENQYLFIAHEVGWLGLGVFLAIIFVTLSKLYKNRRDWLSLGVFASGVGLVVISLIQPVFVDDTVSIVWWGLAAIALASYNKKAYER